MEASALGARSTPAGQESRPQTVIRDLTDVAAMPYKGGDLDGSFCLDCDFRKKASVMRKTTHMLGCWYSPLVVKHGYQKYCSFILSLVSRLLRPEFRMIAVDRVVPGTAPVQYRYCTTLGHPHRSHADNTKLDSCLMRNLLGLLTLVLGTSQT